MYSVSLWEWSGAGAGGWGGGKSQKIPRNNFSAVFFHSSFSFDSFILTFFFFPHIKTSYQVYEFLRRLSFTCIVLRPIKKKTITTASLYFPKWQVMFLCCFMVYILNIHTYFSFKRISLENTFSKVHYAYYKLCKYLKYKLPPKLNSKLRFHSKVFKC